MNVNDAKRIGSLSLIVLLIATIHVIMNSTSPAVAQVDSVNRASSDEVSAASGSNRFVVWVDGTPGNFEIFFRRSIDNGATWQRVVNLSNNPGDSIHARLAVSGSNVYVVWDQENADGTREDIFFRRSTDNGATWGAKVNLSSSGEILGSAEIGVSGNNVYVAWDGLDEGDRTIFFRRSTDGGATWKAIVNLTGSFSRSYGAEIATFGSNVYVVWTSLGPLDDRESEIFFRRSLDGGATWKAITNISQDPTRSVEPEIAASGPNVNVAWTDGKCHSTSGVNCEILVRGSANSGATWMSVKNLSNNARVSVDPQLAASGSNVYLVWTDDLMEVDKGEILFRRSTDGGATWKSTINVSSNPGLSRSQQIAVSGANVYIVWDQYNEQLSAYDVFFRGSTDNGATFKSKVNLSSNGNSQGPQLAASASSVHVAWTDYTAGEPEISFRRSIDSGATWKPAQNLSNNAGFSGVPQIAV